MTAGRPNARSGPAEGIEWRESETERRDVVIGGAGFAGLALAIALRQGLGEAFAVTVVDPALARGDIQGPARLGDRRRRAPAVRGDRGLGRGRRRRAADPRHGGDRLKARRRGAADLPHLRRRGGGGRTVRAHGREPASGRRAGRRRRKSSASNCARGAVSGFEHAANAIDVQLADGETISARLLVGADGARSKIREQAGIATPWLELRSVGDRHHGGARARAQRPRRGTFPARRAVRDFAADGKTLVDRVDRDRARGRAHRRAARRGISRRAGEALRPASRRYQGDRAAPRLSARAVHRALVHRRTAGAGRRRRAHHSSDRRAGAQYGPARRGGFGGGGRRRRAARARYRRRAKCSSAISAGGASTP